MKIEKNKVYTVKKYDLTNDSEINYGAMNGVDVKAIIGTSKYDSEYGMFFTPKATIGYSIEEI